MAHWITEAILRRHGWKAVPVACPACGLSRPPLSTFPTNNMFGVAGLAWLASGRPRIFSTGIECPVCKRPMTMDEERLRRAGRPRPGRS